MVKIKHSNTHTNTTTHPNSLTLKHLPVAPKHSISITNPGGWGWKAPPQESSRLLVYKVSQRYDFSATLHF